MTRTLFYRIGKGYSRRTDKSLNFYIDGVGFFVIEVPGGWPAYTTDGRFMLDRDGRLVTLANQFPVLGENGYIYLPSEKVTVDKGGVISHGEEIIDVFQVVWFKSKNRSLRSFNQTIYYLPDKARNNPDSFAEPKYVMLQGFIEDSTVTKGYIGLVPEWSNGFEGNVKVVKAYVKNMQAAIQVGNPN